MTDHPNRFQGTYLDGRTPKKHSRQLEITPRGLLLLKADVTQELWPFAEIRVEGAEGGGPIHLERTLKTKSGERLESLVVEDRRILDCLYEASPQDRRFYWTASKNRWQRRGLLAAGVVIALALIFIGWTVGLPALSKTITDHVPPEWEMELGKTALTAELGNRQREITAEQQQALETIMDRLLEGNGPTPYTFHLYVHETPMANAFAFPGGHIVILQGMIDLTETAEELAGVLAHEIQHVVRRHSTQGIVRQTASSWILSIITGGTDSALDIILSAADGLDRLRFSREMETEADLLGMDLMLASNIDPQAMITIFRKLDRESTRLLEGVPDATGQKGQKGNETDGEIQKSPESQESGGDSVDISEWLGYLSTHPAGQDRIQALQQRAGGARIVIKPLLPDFDWKTMHSKKKKTAPDGKTNARE